MADKPGIVDLISEGRANAAALHAAGRGPEVRKTSRLSHWPPGPLGASGGGDAEPWSSDPGNSRTGTDDANISLQRTKNRPHPGACFVSLDASIKCRW